MASITSLFFVAFALSAAVILSVDASPLASKVDDEAATHILTVGKREPGDYLVHTVLIVEDLKPGEGYPMVLRREFRVLPSQVITQVVVTDRFTNDEGPDMSIYSGGPGYGYASLLFKAEHYHGINVQIQVYAKHDL